MHKMEQLQTFIRSLLAAGAHKIILSGPVDKAAESRKITLTRYEKGFLCERLTATKAFHETIPAEHVAKFAEAAFSAFSQLNAWNDSTEFSARLSKKGKLLTNKRACAAAPPPASGHNRNKAYILEENSVVPPLVDMGVLTASGAVVTSMRDKFRQINRFLEVLDDVVKPGQAGALRVLDLGCGKSYLTFVAYHYFTMVKKIPVKMTGVDLKSDVIEFCNALARKYGYESLSFEAGDIAAYEPEGGRADLVISLHACDTATDYVLFNAVRWNAEYIFSAPCCQHELAGQISFDAFPLLGGHGIVRERMSSLLTDAVRGGVLNACGYKTQLMEFVDLCHTPKNILIRAQKARLSPESRNQALAQVEQACRQFGVDPTLYRLALEAGYIKGLRG